MIVPVGNDSANPTGALPVGSELPTDRKNVGVGDFLVYTTGASNGEVRILPTPSPVVGATTAALSVILKKVYNAIKIETNSVK